MAATRDTYKGHKIIKLSKDTDDKYPFSFGLAKAELILANIEEIKAFVADAKKEGDAKK